MEKRVIFLPGTVVVIDFEELSPYFKVEKTGRKRRDRQGSVPDIEGIHVPCF
jgi:hypothetical protein